MKKLKKMFLILALFLGTFTVAKAWAIDIYYCDGNVVGVNIYDDGDPEHFNIYLIK